MALVLKSLYWGYELFFYEDQDPRSAQYVLLNPPWLPVVIIGAYLYFVLNLGPKLMANRKPFVLKRLILVYNLVQVMSNAVLCFLGVKLAIEVRMSLKCQPVDYSTSSTALRELQLVYYYYLLKVADLLDTVFFVLRKKQTHVSFLHVYHHTGVLLGAYIYARFIPGGHALMLGLWNTFVHTVMYFYFFLTVHRPELTRNANWKKYITILQMVQFAYLTFHFAQPIVFGYECGIHRFWLWMPTIQNVFMMILFSDFYRRTYGGKRKSVSPPPVRVAVNSHLNSHIRINK
ncbi:elongation of very long chain fatty acids protein AAEL008004-like [Topomyia yanbarensis]|uniref:elongation of very long chain fatty acids protein AAEL008004-like n=1 Tax=Topomyia yanbarensis TaxID=2498891 RepID=UPI00273C4DDC|nr:elongation of very long chain fatty acids protein AAEL008004-like [Topomyia yanbarensis]